MPEENQGPTTGLPDSMVTTRITRVDQKGDPQYFECGGCGARLKPYETSECEACGRQLLGRDSKMV